MATSKTSPKIIMPLADGGILDVKYDSENTPGCPTCDYGSEYIDEFSVVMTGYTIKVYLNVEYEHVISEMWLMHTLLGVDRDLTEEQFAELLYEKISAVIEEGYTVKYSKAPESHFWLEEPDGTPVWEKNFPGIRL